MAPEGIAIAPWQGPPAALPDGTVVSDPKGDVLADLVGPGTELVIAAEGGVSCNAALASSKREAPGFALLGEPGGSSRSSSSSRSSPTSGW